MRALGSLLHARVPFPAPSGCSRAHCFCLLAWPLLDAASPQAIQQLVSSHGGTAVMLKFCCMASS